MEGGEESVKVVARADRRDGQSAGTGFVIMNPTRDVTEIVETPSIDRQTLRSLMQAILTRLQRYRETPLDFEIDSFGIAVEAMNTLGSGLSEQLSDPNCLIGDLDRFVLQHLAVASPIDAVSCIIGAVSCDGPPAALRADHTTLEPAHALARWIESFFHSMRAVDGEAIDLLLQRLQGWPLRSIAQRMNIGLRLTARILSELRQAWTKGEQP